MKEVKTNKIKKSHQLSQVKNKSIVIPANKVKLFEKLEKKEYGKKLK